MTQILFKQYLVDEASFGVADEYIHNAKIDARQILDLLFDEDIPKKKRERIKSTYDSLMHNISRSSVLRLPRDMRVGTAGQGYNVYMGNYRVRAGDQGEVTFHLYNGNARVDLTSADRVNMIVKDSTGNSVTYASDAGTPIIAITDEAAGVVVLSPPDADFWSSDIEYYDIHLEVEWPSSPTAAYPRVGFHRFEVEL